MTLINKRKEDHINTILTNQETYSNVNYFDKILLNHLALPEINFNDINFACSFLDKTLSFPLIISSMTGGSSEKLKNINKNLAIAAEKTQVALAVGSQRIMFEDEAAKESFSLRKYAPSTVLISNLGAIQLNYQFNLHHCNTAINQLDADGLYLHLNPLQETIQPEGNTNFEGLLEKIKYISQNLNTPLLIKEVGYGIAINDVKKLKKIGVKYIDLAGTGGTSFAYIEGLRSNAEIGNTFKNFGSPTPGLIYQTSSIMKKQTLIASGGIRNGLDMAKAIILGANLCSIAKPFLIAANESEETVVDLINKLKKEFQIAMFMLGQKKLATLKNNFSLIKNIEYVKNASKTGIWH
jgi:isopentenyl-diphosphate delta-isomerase